MSIIPPVSSSKKNSNTLKGMSNYYSAQAALVPLKNQTEFLADQLWKGKIQSEG